MTEQSEQQSQKNIIEKIKNGGVTMHSRGYLIWRTTLLVLGIFLLAAAGIFIVSFVIFTLRASGVWDLPQFGMYGLREFLMFFPWLFIPAILLFLWLLERFVLKHSFAYRMPVFYSSVILLVITVGGSVIVLATPLHLRLFQSARNQQLPIAGPIYRFYGHSRPDDFYAGIVTKINEDSYTIQTVEGRQLTIINNSKTKLFISKPLAEGDCLEVIGEEFGGTVTALFIKKSKQAIVVGCFNAPQSFEMSGPPR